MFPFFSITGLSSSSSGLWNVLSLADSDTCPQTLMCPSVSNRGRRRGKPLPSTRRSHIHNPLRLFVWLLLPLTPTYSTPVLLSRSFSSPLSLFLFSFFSSFRVSPVQTSCISCCHRVCPPSLHLSFHLLPISQMKIVNRPPRVCSRAEQAE